MRSEGSFCIFLVSSGLPDHLVDPVVQPVASEELLDRQVHPVTPIMARIGGDVDPLGVGIGIPHFFIDRNPILPCKDAKHRISHQMLLYNAVAEPAGRILRGLSPSAKHFYEVAMCQFLIFPPPTA